MKNYNRVLEVYKEAILNLNNVLSEGQNVHLCEMVDEEGDYTDEFYELPTEFVLGKYGYALSYYLYKVYKEDGKVYVLGKEIEEDADYYFQIDELGIATATYVIDLVDDILNLK